MKNIWNFPGPSNQYHDIFVGDENGEPYTVFVKIDSWIAISVVIFAASEEDAKRRILAGVEAFRDGLIEYKEYSKPFEQQYMITAQEKRIARISNVLTIIASDDGVQIEKLDKRLTPIAPWASNDVIL